MLLLACCAVNMLHFAISSSIYFLVMAKYEMPNHKAWLDAKSEALLDSCVLQRQQGLNPFTRFTDVLRRSNPLLPSLITGLLNTLSTCMLRLWDTFPESNVQFHKQKRNLLDAFCCHLGNLSIFDNRTIDADRLAVDGMQFYIRPATRDPSDPPFANAKHDEHLEAVESLWFLTIILSTSEDAPLVSQMPEGSVHYIPYYNPPQYVTSPRWTNAISLAMVTKFFRMDNRPEPRHRVFRFDISVEDWESLPDGAQNAMAEVRQPQAAGMSGDGAQAAPLPIVQPVEETGYRRIAQVSGNKSSMHGAVSYFVLKLLAVLKEHRKVSTCRCII